MDTQEATMRDGKGRLAPGCSGNPAGKREGTRNRATLLAEALRDGEGVGGGADHHRQGARR
jgi:hypothetical protein